MDTFTTVLSVFSTVCAIVFGYIAFVRNRDKDKESDVKHDATVLTEIGYIKANTDEIKAEQKEQRKTNTEFVTRLTDVEASAKQAHKRLDHIEQRIDQAEEHQRRRGLPRRFFIAKEGSAMSNSKLISCTLISPNKNSPRNHKIDTITIHCVVGQCSAERIGEIFKPTSRQASSNYGIGYDGRIGLYVDEADRSWCSSSAANDNRAITIEVASDTKHPYAVNDKAYAALLDLVEDICRRNGIKKLVWSTSKDDRVNHKNGCNMTVHRDYANKACPGDYLYNRHGEIAAEVNRRLGVPAEEQKPEQKPQDDAKSLYRVQLGAFEKKDNATAFAAKLKKEGFDTYIVQIGKYYKVQVGAFSVKKNAEAMLEKLKKAGHDDAFITYSGTSGGTSTQKITTGSKVRVKAGAKTYSGGSLASFVYSRDHIVKELSGKRAVITYGGTVVAAVNVDDLTLV